MAMKARPAKGHDTPVVDFVPSHMLEKRKCEIHKMIVRRAHELFEHRASAQVITSKIGRPSSTLDSKAK